jgi:aspartate/methionine/tyrosine aminotransferase
MEQWAQISAVCKEMNNFVLFDNAYQGNSIDPSLDFSYPPILNSTSIDPSLDFSYARILSSTSVEPCFEPRT